MLITPLSYFGPLAVLGQTLQCLVSFRANKSTSIMDLCIHAGIPISTSQTVFIVCTSSLVVAIPFWYLTLQHVLPVNEIRIVLPPTF